MPFDPTKPAANSTNSSAEMRGQLTSLKALIDAVQSILAAQVDGVTTLNPGDPAAVTVAVIGDTLHFTFGIPRGQDGQAGQDGGAGPQGPPFASAIVDGVTTLAPGTPATVSVSFDGTNVHFLFGIPTGDTGGQGIPGTPGAPGEVTNAALATAISGTSSNTNAVTTLDTPFADPDAESLRTAYNALVLAARR